VTADARAWTAPPVEGEPASLSVVIPSVNGWGDLDPCLACLERERETVALEVLVVDRLGDGIRRRVAEAYPWVTILPATPGTTIPELRAMAFRAATGTAVAVIEDHVHVPVGWARHMLDALGGEDRVVGGAVENAATERFVDWAAFFCEYSHLIPPLRAGVVDGVTGNNVIYPRPLLERWREAWEMGRWEDHLHRTFREAGIPLVCHPEIVVGHKKHFGIGEYCSQRYHYSRSFAGARLAGAPTARRLVYALAACALPPVLLWRIVSGVWRKRYRRGLLLASLPLLVLFVMAWAAGEAVGAVFGPGDSLGRVR